MRRPRRPAFRNRPTANHRAPARTLGSLGMELNWRSTAVSQLLRVGTKELHVTPIEQVAVAGVGQMRPRSAQRSERSRPSPRPWPTARRPPTHPARYCPSQPSAISCHDACCRFVARLAWRGVPPLPRPIRTEREGGTAGVATLLDRAAGVGDDPAICSPSVPTCALVPVTVFRTARRWSARCCGSC